MAAAPHVAPPRFQELRPDRWRNPAGKGRILAALRLRCRMPDCPGDLGEVYCIEMAPGHLLHVYCAPTGFTRGDSRHPEQAVRFRLSGRARKLAQRGLAPRGRHPHGRPPSFLSNDRAGTWEAYGDRYGLDDGRGILIECPITPCGRGVVIHLASVQAALVERCGLTAL
jgi:hypothetical protein